MNMRILAVLAEASTATACLEGALAASHVVPGAQIEALHIKVDPDKLVEAPEEIAIQRLRERQEGTAEDRARAVRAKFDTWLAALPAAEAARIHWREITGPEAEIVLQEAKTADLLVLARPHDMDAHDAMHAILFSTTRPLLIPPDWSAQKDQGLGGHMVIAWKPTTQARQAVAGAAPWLQHARRVTILVIGDSADPQSLAEAVELLGSFGVSAETKIAPSGEGEPADQILMAAHDLAADVLVMGAYRHGEMIEWALGGTTRTVVAKADMPLFLAH